MKLAFIDVCGFRGYRNPIRIDFADHFTIIDGRNGVGKSTVFDAVEFALTGSIAKYNDVKASQESVADYLWWRGDGHPPQDRYVEVGFRDHGEQFTIRRTQIEEPNPEVLLRFTEKMCVLAAAPPAPLNQACATAIIRDEQITELSLDLGETDRYSLLRNALGANDSDLWMTRAGNLLSGAKKRSAVIHEEISAVNSEVSVIARRIDEIRAGMVAESVVAEAVGRLNVFVGSTLAPDKLAGPIRDRLIAVGAELNLHRRIADSWEKTEVERTRIAELEKGLSAAVAERNVASAQRETLNATESSLRANDIVLEARRLIELVTTGREIGLRDGHCPLCNQLQTPEAYDQGLTHAIGLASALDKHAVAVAAREGEQRKADERLKAANQAVETLTANKAGAAAIVQEIDEQRKSLGYADQTTVEVVQVKVRELVEKIERAQSDLAIVETLRLGGDLERTQRLESEAKGRITRIQDRLGRARRAEAFALALNDAAHRAAGETLDLRLDRVLPLLSELYRRLRPHPVWEEIQYAIRGNIRRFMKLQVGHELNPQFLFSSGQRRATGLAFLLSVNLSLAWSKWRFIMLDDPVQHIDDFRAVHLAEVLAQLVSEGRQVVCAVEDEALADLLCRRLPVTSREGSKRVTLGTDNNGALGIISQRSLAPFITNTLVRPSEQISTG